MRKRGLSLHAAPLGVATKILRALTLVLMATQFTYAIPSSSKLTTRRLEDLFLPRQSIPYSLLGINAFVNESRFGSMRSQLREVKSTLQIKRVRVLCTWNDHAQPTPHSALNFAFCDRIVKSLPVGTEALVILTGTPSWMKNPKNWIGGNPRATFAELFVKKVAARYVKKGRARGFQIWNEPNNPDFKENVTLDVLTKPENFVELVALASAAVKSVAPRKLVVSGATTAIAQNFPKTLNYNKALVTKGILSFVDVYGIHYYGKNVERVLFPGGVAEFANSITKPIWVTETGAQGVNQQREYAERVFGFLKAKMPGIARIYIYQFTESTPAATTYGLRNITEGLSISDLYIKLRDRLTTASRSRRALQDGRE